MAKQKQKQIKMQVQMGALAAIPQLESRTDEQLQGESKHRVAAKAILGARAAALIVTTSIHTQLQRTGR